MTSDPYLGARIAEAILETGGVCFDLVDGTGTILTSLGPANGVLGRGRRVGEGVLDHVHPDDIATTADQVEAVLARPGARALFNIRARHADGSWRLVEVMAVNCSDHPDLGAMVVRTREVEPDAG